MFTDGFFHPNEKWYNIGFGPVAAFGLWGGLRFPLELQDWLQDSDYYPAVVFPFLLNFKKI